MTFCTWLSKYFLVEPSRRQVGPPFTMQLQAKCHATCVIPTPFQLLLMLLPSVSKPEQHILKPVRQIWATESTETSRGKKKLTDDGFMFTFHAFSADSTKRFWRCVIRSCQWSTPTDVSDVIVNRRGHHTHGSDAAGAEVAKSKQTRNVEPWIQWNCHRRFTAQSAQGQLPSIAATQKLIQRARAQNEEPLPTPADLASLVVPDQYNSTILHPMSTNYSCSEIVDKPISIAW